MPAPAQSQVQAEVNCDMPGVFLDGFHGAGALTPATGGSGLGLDDVLRSGLNTVRLIDSDAYLNDVLGSSVTLTQGHYFLCTNAPAPGPLSPSSATVVVMRAQGDPTSLSDLQPDSSADNMWMGGTEDAVDAFYHSVRMRDWLSQNFGLNGFDNARAVFVTVVDAPARLNDGGPEAYYRLSSTFRFTSNISSEPRIVRIGQAAFTAATSGTYAHVADVVGHEWAHGVTRAFSDLSNEREVGALGEAFSDWMGTAFEQPDRDDDDARWLIGHPVATIRDMRNPLIYSDPDTYFGIGWQPADATSCPTPSSGPGGNDNCYIHSNNGVGNKMFQLLADGGVHNGVRVRGIGIARAAQIAMRAQRHEWTANTGYLDARAGMIAAAPSFFALTETPLAWRAVCVDDPRPLPPACPALDTLQALRVRVSSDALNTSTNTAYLRFDVPALTGASGAIGTVYALVDRDPSLDAAQLITHERSSTLNLTVPGRYAFSFTGLNQDQEYTFYALLDRDGSAPGPMYAFPVRIGETAPALRVATQTASARASTLTLVSGMDGTALHWVTAASADDAPASALALFVHVGARAQAVAAGVDGNVLAWDSLAAGTDYVWHVAVMQTLQAGDNDDANLGMPGYVDIPGYYTSARLEEPFRTSGSAIALTLTLSPGRERVGVEANADADGTLHYLVLPISKLGPANTNALAAHDDALDVGVTAGTTTTLSWAALAPDATYTAYAFVRNAAGDSPLVRARFDTLAAIALTLRLSPGRERVGIEANTDADGTLRYLVLPASGTALADVVALAADGRARTATVTAGANVMLDWTGLAPGIAYTAYASVRDADGDRSSLVTAGFNTLAALSLRLTLSPGRERVGIEANANADGTLRYLVLPASDPAPTDAAALFARTDARPVTVTADANVMLDWTGLALGSAYTAYASVRDAEGDSPLVTADFDTLAAIALTLTLSPGRERVGIGADTDANGTLRYLVLLASDPALANADALATHASARTATVTVGANARLDWTGLALGTTYTAYASVRDADGAQSSLVTADFNTLATLSLTLTLSPGPRGVGIDANADADGTLRYLVLPASDPAPADAAALAAHADARAATVTAGTTRTLSWAGLAPGSAYTAYASVRDAEGDQLSLVTESFNTLAEVMLSLSPGLRHIGIDVDVDAIAAGVLYYLVLPASDPPLADAAALVAHTGARTATVTATASVMLDWSELTRGIAYVAYAALRDTEGNSQLVHVRIKTLLALSLTLRLTFGRDRVGIEANANADGTVHYLIAPASEPAPANLAALVAHDDARTATVTAGTTRTLSWTGLAPSTAYAIHAALRTMGDGDTELETAPVMTAADNTGGTGTGTGTGDTDDDDGGGGCALGGGDNGLGLLLVWWCLRFFGRRRPGAPA